MVRGLRPLIAISALPLGSFPISTINLNIKRNQNMFPPEPDPNKPLPYDTTKKEAKRRAFATKRGEKFEEPRSVKQRLPRNGAYNNAIYRMPDKVLVNESQRLRAEVSKRELSTMGSTGGILAKLGMKSLLGHPVTVPLGAAAIVGNEALKERAEDQLVRVEQERSYRSAKSERRAELLRVPERSAEERRSDLYRAVEDYSRKQALKSIFD